MPLKKMSHAFTFTAFVGPRGTTREAFEKRQSHGNGNKELAGHSFGWKLVRLTEPMNTAGGSGKERDRGYTSDDLEVVAMIAQYDQGFSFRIQGKCTNW
jgi:hypothetical protein